MAAGTGFPYVLYDLLKKESSSIVMWTSTGTAFGIRDMTAFRQEVLTCYFKHNKFSSFQRQLNLYGFRKVVKGRESGCYMHPSFLRDSPEKLTEVKRGVVPPCPHHYSRKIYGSGPRFMSQDNGSDSEPELVVQPRGHWDKSLTHSDVATHMKLGEMHVTAAALAAARSQMKESTTGMLGMNSSHAAAAAAAAVHLQAAQAELHGIPGHSRPQPPPLPPHQMMHQMGGHSPSPSTSQGMDVGGRLGAQQHEVDMAGMMRGLHPGEVSMSGNGGGPESGGRYTGVVGGPGCGATTGAPGGEGFRGRPGRTSLSKMFAKRPPMVAAAPGGGICGGSAGGMPPPPSSFMTGGGGSGSSVSGPQPQRIHHGQHQLHPQQQQQQQQFHQQRQHRVMEQHRYNGPSMSDAQGGGSSRGPMGSGHMFSPAFMAAAGQGGRTEGSDMPMGSAPGGGSAIGILNAKAPSPGAAPSRTSHSSTVASLNRLLEGLEQTLDCPPEDEMYTPIDKRNSFCAQMVSIAQVLEDDPMMHGVQEVKNSLGNLQASHLVQKRRSSVSELAAYLHDMLEDGESSRSITIPPGWTLPPPVPRGEAEYSEDGNGTGGAGNRGAFKRTFDGDYGSYDSFGMDGSDGDVSANRDAAADAPIIPSDGCSRSAAAPGSWECTIKREGGGAGGSSNHADSSPRSNPKRARATPPTPTPAPFSGDSVVRHKVWMGGESGQRQRQQREEDAVASRRSSVRMSLEAARAAGKIAASPNLVQALTCLASGLPGLSDSEESRDGGAMEVSGTGEGEHSAQGDPGALSARKGGMTSVRIKEEEAMGREEDSESERAVDAAAEAVVGEPAKHKNSRCGSNAIDDVLTNFSIDRALEQLKSDDGKSDDEEVAGGRAESSQRGMRHRASVYVLMHAIARVNTSNDQEGWEQREGQEPLDCSEGGFAAVI